MVLPAIHLSNRNMAGHGKTESVFKAKWYNLIGRSASPTASPEMIPPTSPRGETKRRKTKFFYSPLLFSFAIASPLLKGKGEGFSFADDGDTPLFLQRPLLSLSRFDVKKICLLWQLPIYPDASNRNLKYARNRLRKQVLPALRLHLNPQLDRMMIQFTKLAATEQIYIEYLSQRISPLISVLRPGYMTFHVSGLTSLPLALRRRILKESLERHATTSLHLSHVEDFSTFLEKSNFQGYRFPDKGRVCLLPLREEEAENFRRRPLFRLRQRRSHGPTLGRATTKHASDCFIYPIPPSWKGGESTGRRGFLTRYFKAHPHPLPLWGQGWGWGRVPLFHSPLYPPKGDLGGRAISLHTVSLPPSRRVRRLNGSCCPIDRISEHLGVATQWFLPSVGSFLFLRDRLE